MLKFRKILNPLRKCCCNIINIIIAQWAKLRKKIATFLSLFIFTTFSVHTFSWCGKSLLGITKVTRYIRLTHIHCPDAGAFTNYVEKTRQVGGSQKCQPGVGRWLRMGIIWSTQFLIALLHQTQCSGMTHFTYMSFRSHISNLFLKSARCIRAIAVDEKGSCTTIYQVLTFS